MGDAQHSVGSAPGHEARPRSAPPGTAVPAPQAGQAARPGAPTVGVPAAGASGPQQAAGRQRAPVTP
eukprot:6858615-Alexandrium_andersonii.AAC.1